MEQRRQPNFRGFLGTGLRPSTPKRPCVKFSQQGRGLAGYEEGEVSTRAYSAYSSGSVPGPVVAATAIELTSATDRHLEFWKRGNGPEKSPTENEIANGGLGHAHRDKRARSPSGSVLSREHLHLNKDCSLQSSKIPLFKQKDNTGGLATPTVVQEDANSSKPPQLESSWPPSIWMQTSIFKTDLTTGALKRVKYSKSLLLNLASSSGTSAADPVSFGALAKASMSSGNTAGGWPVCESPGDEGSRTGLPGSGLATLLKACTSELPTGKVLHFQQHSNLASGSTTGLQSCGNHISAPVSRPLTVFYGGQAHVFDDVSPQKVDTIMMLAGSNGRSWSTIYTPQGSVCESSWGNEVPFLNPIKHKVEDEYRDNTISCSTSWVETLSSNLLQSLHPTRVDILQSG